MLGVTDGAEAEIMTLPEVANYLQLAERTVLRMAQRGEIPAAKIASQWRFMRHLVQDWLVSQMQGCSTHDAQLVAPPVLLPLSEVVKPSLMVFDLGPGPKERILRRLVAPLLESGLARDANRFLAALLERERMMTTAIGHGVAIPHPRRPMPGMFTEPAVVLGICPEGTDFDAIDDRLVHVFFLICATREDIHLQLMANISWFVRHPAAITDLGTAANVDRVTEIVTRHFPD